MWLCRALNCSTSKLPYAGFYLPPAGKRQESGADWRRVNGYGKTTLLEALYVGLYGEEAVKHKALDSAGLKAKSYGSFLETAFHRLSPGSGEDRMEVQVEFMREDGGALRVTRKWFFKGNGKYDKL